MPGEEIVSRLLAMVVLLGVTAVPTLAQSADDVVALQVAVISAWMAEEPEYTVCLRPLASAPGWPPNRADTGVAPPADQELEAVRSALGSTYPTRVSPYCIVVDEGVPQKPLDRLRDRAGTRYSFCTYARSVSGWVRVGRCDATNISHQDFQP